MVLQFIFLVTLAFAWKIGDEPNPVDTSQAVTDIKAGATKTDLGGFHICDMERIEFDTHVHMTKDGEEYGWFEDAEDILVEGIICGSKNDVVLALDDGVLHGTFSFGVEGEAKLSNGMLQTMPTEVDLDAEDDDDIVRGFLEPELLEKLKAMEKEEHFGRRRLSTSTSLEPGEVDVHIKLVIDKHMIDELGSEFAAARYGVELTKLVSRTSFYPMGFNIIVSEIDLRSRLITQEAGAEPYKRVLRAEGVPDHIHLITIITTRNLGGGSAGKFDIYSSHGGCGVANAMHGDFDRFDRSHMAHEMAHSFGTDHTYDYFPKLDRCKQAESGTLVGTPMSSCSSKISSLSFHPRVQKLIQNAYATLGTLKPRFQAVNNHPLHQTCKDFAEEIPQDHIPFTLEGNGGCISSGIDYSACGPFCEVSNCKRDAIWQRVGSKIIKNVDWVNKNFDMDESYCWTTTSNCDGIVLELCDGRSNAQKFDFSISGIQSRSCGRVNFAGNGVSFDQGSRINHWCKAKFTPPPKCSTALEPISCGEKRIGSTVDSCNGEHNFLFYGTYGKTTLSVCSDIDFAMTLKHKVSGEIVMYGVQGENSHSGCTVLQNLDLPQPRINSGKRGNFLDFDEYHVSIAGFGGQRGSYEFELTCSDNSCPTGGSCKADDAEIGCWPELDTEDMSEDEAIQGSCKAHIDHMRFRTCWEYCGHLGLACVSMETDVIIGQTTNSRGEVDNVEQYMSVSCDHITVKNDAMCECAPFPAPASNRFLGRIPEDVSSNSPDSNSNFGVCDMSSWPDKQKTCGACKASVSGMRRRSCDQYCQEQGLECAGSWRVGDEDDCQLDRPKTCSEEGGSSNGDLICQCMQPSRPARGVCDVSKWPLVETECGDCKALVQISEITCNDYCKSVGLSCIGQFEESGNSCDVEEVQTCDMEIRKDAICECQGAAVGYTEFSGKRVARNACEQSGGSCDEMDGDQCVSVAVEMCNSYWDCVGFQVRHTIGFEDDIVYFSGSESCVSNNMNTDSSWTTYVKGATGIVSDDNPPDRERDCAGVLGGHATEDACGVCNGDGSSCVDCAGIPNGSAAVDACGVCDGDGSTCAGSNSGPNSGGNCPKSCERGSKPWSKKCRRDRCKDCEQCNSGDSSSSDSDSDSSSSDSDSSDSGSDSNEMNEPNDQCTPSLWDDVKLVCGPCKVLADTMSRRSCDEYCEENGLHCIAAWEEVKDNCEVKETRRCDQLGGGTSDIICECGSSPNRNRRNLDDGNSKETNYSDRVLDGLVGRLLLF